MKRTPEKSFSRSLTNALLRGLAVFAVFGAAVYVYAAISYPAVQPNPVSGVVGLYVGKTAGTYNGAGANGYQNANDFCANGGGALADSHICTSMEIMNTYNHNPSALSALTGAMWMNNGAPAYTTAAPNDCNGWTNNTKFFFGASWNFDIDFGTASSCNLTQPFACCK